MSKTLKLFTCDLQSYMFAVVKTQPELMYSIQA